MHIGPIDLRAGVCAGVVWAECAGHAEHQSLGVGNIERGGQARGEDKVARSTQGSIQGCPTMESVCAQDVISRIAEAECGAALAIEYTESRLRIECRWQEP